MSEWIGWGATGLFASSYWFREPRALRRVQAAAASAWILYGVMIGSLPVVVSNLLVATLALLSSVRRG